MNLFNFDKMSIDKPIRLIELFGGIGSQAMALRDIGADFVHYRLVEFDKYAVQCYNAVHGTNFETTDIKNVSGADLGIVDTDKYTYIMTYSFPCTDLSVAGKMKGMSKKDWEAGKDTKSGLLWEVERILKELPKEQLPQVLLMENVPQVHADKNIYDFENWLGFLRSKGYQNFWEDLNAVDYGIPQNRKRCFCVSVLSDEIIDFDFPEGKSLELRMKDMLENNVDEKYYINNDKAKKLIDDIISRGKLPEEQICIDLSLFKPQEKIVANAITSRENRSISNRRSLGNGVICKNIIKEAGFMPHNNGTVHQSNKVYFSEGISPCLNSVMGVHHNIIKIIEETKCVGGLSESKWGDKQYHQQDKVYKGDIALAHAANIPGESYHYLLKKGEKTAIYPVCCAMRGRDPDNPTSRKVGLPTVQKDNLVMEDYRIRKLTPKECWRLMGYTDEDFEKAKAAGVSNSNLYKQAGNAIVKQVLMAIFRQMNIKGVK